MANLVRGTTRDVVKTRLTFVRVLPSAGGLVVLTVIAIQLAAAAAPVAGAVLTGVVIGRIDVGIGSLALPLGAVGLMFLLEQVLVSWTVPLEYLAARRIEGTLRQEAATMASGVPDLLDVVDPTVQDDLALVTEGNSGFAAGMGSVGVVALTCRFLGAVAGTAILWRFSGVVAATLLGAMLLMRALLRRQFLGISAATAAHKAQARRVGYWSDLLSNPAGAKEIRLFGLGRWFLERFRADSLAKARPVWLARRRVLLQQPGTMMITGLAVAVTLAALGAARLRGDLGIADLAMYVQAAWAVLAIGSMGAEAHHIEHGLPALHAIERLRSRLRPDTAVADGPPARSITPEIRFDDVWFGYPGATGPVLRGLSLTIRSGECLALVGDNGSGKSTVVGVLAGLYPAQAGRVVVAGADLHEFGVSRWQRQVAVLFQDFLRYETTLRDNVRLGAPTADAPDGTVDLALTGAGAAALRAQLPEGVETVLAPGYTGGVDLSDGQWQRVALARALFAAHTGRRVLLLDEPSRHLDVDAELELVDRVRREVPGATVVLVSHRFSTVRLADRIAVISDGVISELGTHDELMIRDGRYARMFRTQAGAFHGVEPSPESSR